MLQTFSGINQKIALYNNRIYVENTVDGVVAAHRFKDGETYSQFDLLGISNVGELLSYITIDKEYNLEIIDSKDGGKAFAAKINTPEHGCFTCILGAVGKGPDPIAPDRFEAIAKKFHNLPEKTVFNVTWDQLRVVLENKTIIGSDSVILVPEEDRIRFVVGRMVGDESYNSCEKIYDCKMSQFDFKDEVKLKFKSNILVKEDYTIEITASNTKFISASGVEYFIFPTKQTKK